MIMVGGGDVQCDGAVHHLSLRENPGLWRVEAGFLTALAVALTGVVAAIGLAGGKVVAVLTYMVCDVVVVTPMVLFWGLAVGVLNPKESKQWFGLIGAAGTVGCIVAGYVVSLASRSGQVDVLSLGLVTGLMVVVLVGLARTTLFDQGSRDQNRRRRPRRRVPSVCWGGCWGTGRRC